LRQTPAFFHLLKIVLADYLQNLSVPYGSQVSIGADESRSRIQLPRSQAKGHPALCRCGAMRVKGSFTTAIALAVLVAVAAVLIAPSIDMPETTLREHHVTSHSASNNSSGNLTSLGTASLLRAFQTIDVNRPSDGPQFSTRGQSQSSLVLRC